MTVLTLIKSTFRKIGGRSLGESTETDRLAEALEALQSMLRSWAQKQILVFASIKESFIMTSGQASYTWGTGGNISTTRPNQVLGVFIRDAGGTDYPVDIIAEGRYRTISSKATLSRPEYLFYHPLYPLGYIYLFPTPDVAETMHLESLKPFTETSSFGTVNDTIAFPPNYEEALIYNLAIRLAPEYGVQMSPEAIATAKESYDAMINLNAQNQVESVELTFPVLPIFNRDGFNIYRGW
jgi:hypothetical protein